jgi:hypothetical protein
MRAPTCRRSSVIPRSVDRVMRWLPASFDQICSAISKGSSAEQSDPATTRNFSPPGRGFTRLFLGGDTVPNGTLRLTPGAIPGVAAGVRLRRRAGSHSRYLDRRGRGSVVRGPCVSRRGGRRRLPNVGRLPRRPSAIRPAGRTADQSRPLFYHYEHFSKTIDALEEGRALIEPRAKALVDRAGRRTVAHACQVWSFRAAIF